MKGRLHIYPEMAAAGLWTTASDLARFAIGIQQSLAAKSNPVISQAMTRQMFTPGGTDWPSRVQESEDGLGVFLGSRGEGLIFWHGGRNEGFDASIVANAHAGQGAAIMIDSNDIRNLSIKLQKLSQKNITGRHHNKFQSVQTEFHAMLCRYLLDHWKSLCGVVCCG